jgi:hypothetical protein
MRFGLIISNLKRIKRLFGKKKELPQLDETTGKWNESHSDLDFANIYKVVNRFHALFRRAKNEVDKNKVADLFYLFMKSKKGCAYELPYPENSTNALKTAHLGLYAAEEERMLTQICDMANHMEDDNGLEVLTPHIKSSMPHSSRVDIETIINRQKQDLLKRKCPFIHSRFLIVQQFGPGSPIIPRSPTSQSAESVNQIPHHIS